VNKGLYGKCGTPGYMAPEVVTDREAYSFEADVWALGIFMYHMIVGEAPFTSYQENREVKI